VYAFEPQPQNFELLEANIRLNRVENVVAVNQACGDQNGEVKMPVFTEEPSRMLNMGDITPNRGFSNNNFRTIPSIRLDYWNNSCNEISLIKLDVQGWELKVLSGATELIKRHKPVLIVEFENFQLAKTNTSCKDLFDFIREQGYYIYFLDYSYPCDHVCIPIERLVDFQSKFKEHIFPHRETNTMNYNVEHGVGEKIVM
jgi:FkbM family methyltransferase